MDLARSQHVYENERDLKEQPKVLRNTTNSRFVILALVLGAVSLIASVSALVAAIVLVNNLESEVATLKLQNKALESTNIEQSSLLNNLQEKLLNCKYEYSWSVVFS